MQKENLEKEDIKNYLCDFSLVDMVGQHKLVLKVFKAERDVASMSTKWRNVEIVFTVDDFILIFDENQRNAFVKSKIKLKVQYIKLKKITDK